MDWQPIENAPKDGKWILLYRPTAYPWAQVAIGHWEGQRHHKRPSPYWSGCLHIGGVSDWKAWAPTHWMPLPTAPKGEAVKTPLKVEKGGEKC